MKSNKTPYTLPRRQYSYVERVRLSIARALRRLANRVSPDNF
jgi:hypothetical protein